MNAKPKFKSLSIQKDKERNRKIQLLKNNFAKRKRIFFEEIKKESCKKLKRLNGKMKRLGKTVNRNMGKQKDRSNRNVKRKRKTEIKTNKQ